MSDDITSLRVRVEGIVQGVGFRAFLKMAAMRNGLMAKKALSTRVMSSSVRARKKR